MEGPQLGAGVHMKGCEMNLADPGMWIFEDSLCAKFTFIPDRTVRG